VDGNVVWFSDDDLRERAGVDFCW